MECLSFFEKRVSESEKPLIDTSTQTNAPYRNWFWSIARQSSNGKMTRDAAVTSMEGARMSLKRGWASASSTEIRFVGLKTSMRLSRSSEFSENQI